MKTVNKPSWGRRGAMVGASLVALGVSAALQAQEDLQLEEVVVTAERVERDLQTTPVSVIQISGEQMREMGAENIQELASFLPNVSIAPRGGGEAQFTIRGVGQIRTGISGDRSVGYYVDDQFYSRTTGSSMRMLDLANVEVLRGPQGTLFGRNNTGGAIRFTTAKPQDEFAANVKVGVGDGGRFETQGMLNLPLVSDRVLLRAAGARYKRDGYVHGLNGQDLGNTNQIDGRIALRFKFTDDFIGDISYTNSKTNEAGFAMVPWGGDVNPYQISVLACEVLDPVNCPRATPFVELAPGYDWVGVPLQPDPAYNRSLKITDEVYSYVGGDRQYDRNNQKVLNGSLNWNINDNVSAQLISGLLKIDSNRFTDADGTPWPIGTQFNHTGHKSWSEELHVAFKGLFNGKVDGIAGLFYFDEQNAAQSYTTSYDDLAMGAQAWQVVNLDNGFGTFPLRPGQDSGYPWLTPARPGYVLNIPGIGVLPVPATPSFGLCPQFYPVASWDNTPILDPTNPFAPAQYAAPVAGPGAQELMGCIDTTNLGQKLTTTFQRSSAKSWAAFLDGTYHWTDRWSSSAGVRYSKDDKTWDIDGRVTAYDKVIKGANGKWDALDWRFITKFEATDDLMFYGSVAKAYKSGGFTDSIAFGFGGFSGFGEAETLNPLTGEPIDSPFIPYKPETVVNYELGMRSEWLNHRLRANLTAFRMDYSDKQTQVMILPGQSGGNTEFANSYGGGPVIMNAAKVLIDGVEGDFAFAVTRNLTLGVNAAWLDGRYDELDGLVDSVTLSTPLDSAPKYSLSASANYSQPMFGGMGSAQINYAYTSEQWNGADEQIQWHNPSLSLVNMRLGFFSGSGRWNLGAYVNNLMDKQYLYGGMALSRFGAGAVGFTGGGNDIIFPARRREYGFDVSYSFGALPRFGRR